MTLALVCAGLLTVSPQAKDPFEILAVPSDAAPLVRKLGDKDHVFAVEGDVLTVLYRSKGESVQLTGGIQKPMQKLPNSDVWALQLKMPGWDKAFISYAFFDTETLKPGTHLEFKRWRGPNAPAAPAEAAELKGQIIKRTFRSGAMKQDRPITIYLPPNAPKTGLPALFMADGGGCDGMARVIEPLILAGKMKPVAIIGVHSGENYNKQGENKMELDHRATEYLPGAERYEMHMKFFADEVPAWASKEFGVSNKREDRAVFGFSNGGSFSAGACLERPGVFGAAIPMSVGVPAEREKPSGTLPKMYFIAGVLESSFASQTTKAYEQAKAWDADASLKLYFAGHDWEMWKLALAEYAPTIFPPN